MERWSESYDGDALVVLMDGVDADAREAAEVNNLLRSPEGNSSGLNAAGVRRVVLAMIGAVLLFTIASMVSTYAPQLGNVGIVAMPVALILAFVALLVGYEYVKRDSFRISSCALAGSARKSAASSFVRRQAPRHSTRSTRVCASIAGTWLTS